MQVPTGASREMWKRLPRPQRNLRHEACGDRGRNVFVVLDPEGTAGSALRPASDLLTPLPTFLPQCFSPLGFPESIGGTAHIAADGLPALPVDALNDIKTAPSVTFLEVALDDYHYTDHQREWHYYGKGVVSPTHPSVPKREWRRSLWVRLRRRHQARDLCS